jgi:ABC-type spermidine/putrescine transport system permease subunit II
MVWEGYTDTLFTRPVENACGVKVGLLSRGITPEVNAASAIIFLVSVAVIVVWSRLIRSDQSAAA